MSPEIAAFAPDVKQDLPLSGRSPLPPARRIHASGANAAISGDMLTTAGITIERDMQMLGELGYIVK